MVNGPLGFKVSQVWFYYNPIFWVGEFFPKPRMGSRQIRILFSLAPPYPIILKNKFIIILFYILISNNNNFFNKIIYKNYNILFL